MKFETLTPNIFYTDINVGLNLFVECLDFSIGYDDLKSTEHPCCVIARDGLKIFLHQDQEFAEKDRPELRLEIKNIEEVYDHVSENFPELLHPNLKKVTLRPWNAKEFALLDKSGVCIIIQEW
jgi:hypothetical protein